MIVKCVSIHMYRVYIGKIFTLLRVFVFTYFRLLLIISQLYRQWDNNQMSPVYDRIFQTGSSHFQYRQVPIGGAILTSRFYDNNTVTILSHFCNIYTLTTGIIWCLNFFFLFLHSPPQTSLKNAKSEIYFKTTCSFHENLASLI